MNLNKVKSLIEEQNIAAIDLKYADLTGNWFTSLFHPDDWIMYSNTAFHSMVQAFPV